MGTRAEDLSTAEGILKLLKDAMLQSRDSSDRLCGLARGLEIGISKLQDARSTDNDPVGHLQRRSLRLSESRDGYHSGVALGISLATHVASAMLAQERLRV